MSREWEKFWNGEQNRPMVNIVLTDPHTPAVPEYRHFFPQYPWSMSVEEIVAIESRQLARLRWAGKDLCSTSSESILPTRRNGFTRNCLW